MLVLGVDPGIKNTGFCLIDKNVEVIESGVVPANIDTVNRFTEFNPDVVAIERFVSYKGKFVDLELINRFIGMLEYAFSSKHVILVKAIDWQIGILKDEKSLPKKFSRNGTSPKKFRARDYAYKQFGKKFKTEHEADAFLLAYYGLSQFKKKS